MFTGNWCYSVKLSLKGWKLVHTGKILQQQYLPAKAYACIHTGTQMLQETTLKPETNSRYLTDLCVNDCQTLLNFIINYLPTVIFALSFFWIPSCVTASPGRPQLQGGTEDPGEMLSSPRHIRAVLHILDTMATQQAGVRG